MITRRRLTVAAITASCAAIALLGVGSGAMASINPTTSTGQIKACYETSGSLRPLDHIVTTGKCPPGDSSLTWNQTGPRGPAGPQGPAGAQGPAGVSAGLSASGTTGLSLNTGVNNFTPVLTTPTATVGGTY